jgi:hypothetical protein
MVGFADMPERPSSALNTSSAAVARITLIEDVEGEIA